MSRSLRYGEGIKILPILKPQDIAATTTATSYVDLDLVNWATFLVQFGNMTSDTTDVLTIKVESSTAGSSNATEVNVAFSYRLGSAVDSDSLGAITAATASAGATLDASTGDNKFFIIDLDPAVVAATADMRFVRLTIAPDSNAGITLVNALAFLEPRYPGNAIPSST